MTALVVPYVNPDCPETGEPTSDDRTWCADCYARREAWVIRALGEHGVAFEPRVLPGGGVCHTCRTVLGPGTQVVLARYPLRRPAADHAGKTP